MKKIKGWWFAEDSRELANGDGRKIKLGITHKVKGEIIPCKNGLHLSPKILDALTYAPGNIIYMVEGTGTIVPHGNPIDKYACSERTYISGGIDASKTISKFARLCALDVIHLWDAPEVVVRYLKTGDVDIRDSTWAATWAATAAARAAADSTWAAALAATDSTRAATDSVWAAATAAANAATRAVRDAAWAAAQSKQNARLTRMIKRIIK